MPFMLPLALPSGIVRPGTVYQARRRWYDANLVRWDDATLQPIGGWTSLGRVAEVGSVAAAIEDDGGVFTDQTADAQDTGNNDVDVFSSNAIGDAFYIGGHDTFAGLTINGPSTNGGTGVGVWEYWNGSSWATLTTTLDDSNVLQSLPILSFNPADEVRWDPPVDWATTTVNGQGPFYYVRARVTTAGSPVLTSRIDLVAGDVKVSEPIRGMLAWRGNLGAAHLGFGTATRLFHFSEGDLTEITPSGFTTGGEDAVQASGTYGTGIYGAGLYGVGNELIETTVEANTWQLDNFGEDLIALAHSDGDLYRWDRSAGGVATVIAAAPTGNLGVVVTPERFVVALGAGGDRRLVQWSDQEDADTWTPTDTNQAGDLTIPGPGQLMFGRRSRGETLVWTDHALYALRFIGGGLVYSLVELGSHCGVIGRMAGAEVNGRAFWMGRKNFYVYDGFVRPLPSPIEDYVFGDLNRVQASKIHCEIRTSFDEVWWFYPSEASVENDRYVVYNYVRDEWNIGQLERTSGVDEGAFAVPLGAAASGAVYLHETGTEMLDTDGTPLTPLAETGPIEIGNGDRLMMVVEVIPDEANLGDTEVTLFASKYPTADETSVGPLTAAEPTPVRITGRWVRLRLDQVNEDWRFGTPRLQLEPCSRR